MRYFIDTEFIADGTNLDLLSVGIVCEDGREFYGENRDCDLSRSNDWVRAHVWPHLDRFTGGNPQHVMPSNILESHLSAFVGWDNADTPEFWGWCCAFDYVVICQLFGMDHWPRDWPMFFNDVAQLARERGADLSQFGDGPHDALADAREVQRIWTWLGAPR